MKARVGISGEMQLRFGYFGAAAIKDGRRRHQQHFGMLSAMSTETATRVDGRPPVIHMQDPGITLFCASSKLFAYMNTTDNTTTIMAHTRRVGGKFADLQEVVRVGANVEGDIKVPWVCPWPYTITDWSREHVRVDSEEDPSFWCVLTGDLLPVPLAYIEME